MREIEKQGTVVFVPDHPGVIFTTRLGGFSRTPFEGLNLGFATGDDVDVVRRNRHQISDTLGIDTEWVTGHQVHGSSVLEAGPGHAGGPPPRPIADAVVTSVSGLPIVVLTADCVPIALVDHSRMGAVHAGWRGIAGGVIESAAAACGSGLLAIIGPSIGPCHYEVGPDVPQAFAVAYPDAPDFTTRRDEKLNFDLRAAARWILRRLGVEVGDYSIPCTMCDPRFYSHRRDGVTGRQALIMWR